WLLMAVLICSGAATFYICRREMVEIFREDSEDADIHPPAQWAIRPWRKLGALFILSSAAVGLVGLWFVQSDEYRGAFLLAPSIFPHVFGWIMRLQPPETAFGLARIAER
ncbi:MAG TPA: hypothetical protein VJ822_08930, partial [Dongiaceae bacterium]|nr:hypothetical protein [Dongiaceae bacterium]